MSLNTRLGDLVTAIGTDIKQLRTWITGSSSGNLTGLTTSDKTSIVAAINELVATAGGGGDVTQADLTALRNEILGLDVPAALDTLDELAAALGDDPNFAATVATGLSNRLRVDIDNQNLTGTQRANGRTNLDVYSKTEIGNPDADLVAAYNAAKA